MVAMATSYGEYVERREARLAELAARPVADHAWVRRLFAVVDDDPHRVTAAGSYWNTGDAGVEVAIVFDFGHDGRVAAFAAYLAVDLTGGAGVREMVRRATYGGLKLREAEARGMLIRHEGQLASIPYRA